MRAKLQAALLVWLAFASPAVASDPIFMVALKVPLIHVVVGPVCGALSNAESHRLRNALIAEFRKPAFSGARGPQLTEAEIAAVQEQVDRMPTTGETCVRAWRFLPAVQERHPPQGVRPPRQPTHSTEWLLAWRRLRADTIVALLAARCDLLSAEDAHAIIARSASIPAAQLALTLGEITDATREGVAAARAATTECAMVPDMLDYAEQQLAEDDTGWVLVD